MERVPGHKSLTVYQKAHELVSSIYKATKHFPKEELFGLTSQMRRCSVSVPANISEGYGRRTMNDKLQFYYIARGSLNELEYYLDLSADLGYLPKVEYQKMTGLREEVGKLLNGFIRSIR
jgi:four helix bundle protein